MLRSVFSANPPLFSAPTSTPPPPPVAAHGRTVPAGSASSHSHISSHSYSMRLPVPTTATITGSSGGGQYWSPAAVAVVDSRSEKVRLIAEVTKKLQGELQKYYEKSRVEIKEEMKSGKDLETNADKLRANLASMKRKNEEATRGLETIQKLSGDLDAWVAAKQAAAAAADSTSTPLVDESALVPLNPVSEQLVKLHADIDFIKDYTYKLDQAFSDGSNRNIQLSEYLRECRSMAKEEFLKRRHINKIETLLTANNQKASFY